MDQTDRLSIDLSDIEVEQIEILLQEGSRGIPEFAASSSTGCICQDGGCSCSQAQPFGD